jgi:iron(III) transport system substrate-binding protein
MPEAAKKKGAPIDWIALEPAVARSNGIGIARRAPHPNAALLFYDYFISEGQSLLVAMDYVPTNTSVQSPLKSIRIKIVDPVLTLDEMDKWTKSFHDIVIKRAGG